MSFVTLKSKKHLTNRSTYTVYLLERLRNVKWRFLRDGALDRQNVVIVFSRFIFLPRKDDTCHL